MGTVLVTGAAGFIGSHLAEACLLDGWKVRAVDALTDSYDLMAKDENSAELRETTACEWIEADLVHARVDELVDDVDVVFHLAGEPGVRASWGAEFARYLDNNVLATQRLLEAAKGAAIDRFVVASSSSVYGDASVRPTAEDALLAPVSPYGASKLMAEELAGVYCQSAGVPAVVVRYFSVYGPRQRPDMAFRRLIGAALGGVPAPVFGDGEQRRDFTYVADAVAGTLAAARHGRVGKAYNLASGRCATLNTAIASIRASLGADPPVEPHTPQMGDVRHTAANVRKARFELGFEAAWTLDEGLEAQVAWQRSQTGSLSTVA